MPLNKESLTLNALRGATTCSENSPKAIAESVEELTTELVKRNKLSPNQIISITFSVTNDLDACFPASVARKKHGWEKIALLDCQQMMVKGDLDKCIRILAHVWMPHNQLPVHPYLRQASLLRPDRSN